MAPAYPPNSADQLGHFSASDGSQFLVGPSKPKKSGKQKVLSSFDAPALPTELNP